MIWFETLLAIVVAYPLIDLLSRWRVKVRSRREGIKLRAMAIEAYLADEAERHGRP